MITVCTLTLPFSNSSTVSRCDFSRYQTAQFRFPKGIKWLAIDEEGRCSADSGGFYIGSILVENAGCLWREKLGLRCLRVQSGRCCNPNQQLRSHAAMGSPFWLITQYGLQYGFEDALHARSLKNANGNFGTLTVKWGVADDDAHGIAMLSHDVLYDRMKSPACLASRVEELDDGHGRVSGTKNGRVGADQRLRKFWGNRLGLRRWAGAGSVPGRASETGDSKRKG